MTLKIARRMSTQPGVISPQQWHESHAQLPTRESTRFSIRGQSMSRRVKAPPEPEHSSTTIDPTVRPALAFRALFRLRLYPSAGACGPLKNCHWTSSSADADRRTPLAFAFDAPGQVGAPPPQAQVPPEELQAGAGGRGDGCARARSERARACRAHAGGGAVRRAEAAHAPAEAVGAGDPASGCPGGGDQRSARRGALRRSAPRLRSIRTRVLGRNERAGRVGSSAVFASEQGSRSRADQTAAPPPICPLLCHRWMDRARASPTARRRTKTS